MQNAMQKFTTKIVQMMKDEKLFESQGGPIILSQIENEYGAESHAFGAAGHAYLTWAAKMAVGLNTGVPWVMCKQDDAPDPIINTCNGFYCDYFSPNNKETKPTMWTEAWSGWFSDFGGPIPHRPVQDLAFAVARFVQKGGSFTNYYMYHGGTNFGRTAGGPFITTSYDYDAPIDEYGLLRQPKYDHLKELHKAIKSSERAILSADPAFVSLGTYEQAHVFSSKAGGCAAFIANYHLNSSTTVTFRKKHYTLPPWSISILPDCKHAVYNTAQVGTKTSLINMLPTNVNRLAWQTFSEDVSTVDSDSKMTVSGLLDQVSVTRDASDYLWYTTSVVINPSELHRGSSPSLSVESEGHALHVYVNNQLIGSAFGGPESRKVKVTGNANLRAGTNKISLLSVAVGLQNNGPHFELWKTGVLGPVVLHGVGKGSWDLSRQKWSYQVGLKGESMNLAAPTGISSVDWTESSLVAQMNRPLTWYKAYFNAPQGGEPLAIDMKGMGKGQVWINGQSIGRYWTIHGKGSCNVCNYAGTYRPVKCQTRCGVPTQRWYHVPQSWLKPTQNLIIMFEEIGGDPSTAHVFSSKAGGCAAFIANYHLNSSTTVTFRKKHYTLPPWSISILPDCKHAVYNTAQVGTKTSLINMLPTNVNRLAWQAFSEDVSTVDSDSKMTVSGLLDQVSVTRDASDYLWYTTSVVINPSELHRGSSPSLSVESEGHALHVYVNNQLIGSAFGGPESRKVKVTGNANLRAGTNKISLLSVAVGLQVGLKGESMNLAAPTGISSVDWTESSLVAQMKRPLTWYKAYFNAPQGGEPLAIDMKGMGKGQVWINGQSIGRYWTIHGKGSCNACNYAGTYRPVKCQTRCGVPTQRWYHVPRSWLKPTQNMIIMFEEIGGDPSTVSIMKRTFK
ncbi:glycoside hydrolase, family 35 [Artemisia annua]|uniref:Beta-galactosidase n=1 Tax=Artemisia annua TaxID=35608 RepID=A0A2U1PG71_ARTAN|nr:glycoside hydrolase, family 35 [Artemisia annua]